MKKLNKQIFYKEYLPKVLKELDYTNPMQAPRLKKVVVNIGAGDASSNQKIIENIAEELALITGQKPILIHAKKSIAAFKLRENAIIGLKVTLRGNKMYSFVNKLINIAIPRIRDFQGVNPRSFDGRGNYTLGIKEQIIFPEIEYDKVQKVRGMDITFVTTKNSDSETYVLLKTLGLPFANRKA